MGAAHTPLQLFGFCLQAKGLSSPVHASVSGATIAAERKVPLLLSMPVLLKGELEMLKSHTAQEFMLPSWARSGWLAVSDGQGQAPREDAEDLVLEPQDGRKGSCSGFCLKWAGGGLCLGEIGPMS